MKFYCILLMSIVFFIGCKQNTSADKANWSLDEEALYNDSSKSTQIQWIDSIVNIGTITMGDTVNVHFKFKNIGKQPLVVLNVEPTCGCTVADYTKKPVAPGEIGEVIAAFDSKKSQVGTFTKGISVRTNTLPDARHYISFKGEIVEPINNFFLNSTQ